MKYIRHLQRCVAIDNRFFCLFFFLCHFCSGVCAVMNVMCCVYDEIADGRKGHILAKKSVGSMMKQFLPDAF